MNTITNNYINFKGNTMDSKKDNINYDCIKAALNYLKNNIDSEKKNIPILFDIKNGLQYQAAITLEKNSDDEIDLKLKLIKSYDGTVSTYIASGNKDEITNYLEDADSINKINDEIKIMYEKINNRRS